MRTTMIRTAIAGGVAALATTGLIGYSWAAANEADPSPSTDASSQSENAPADEVAETGASSAVTMAECLDDNLVAEPETFTTACGDANEHLTGLAWTDWGTDEAKASGTLENTMPGDESSVPATVVAKDLVKGEAAARYTTLVVTTADDSFEVSLPGIEPAGDLSDDADLVDAPADN